MEQWAETFRVKDGTSAAIKAQQIRLTPIEWRLLEALARNAGRVVGHRRLREVVWGPDYSLDTAGLRTYIKQLRKKLASADSGMAYIHNESGVDYTLRRPG